MKQRSATIARTADAQFLTMEEKIEERAVSSTSNAEWGRKAILVGWLVATLGIVGYVYTLLRAEESAGILDSIRAAGAIGWLSVLMLAGGVAIWLAGNIALLRALADDEPELDE